MPNIRKAEFKEDGHVYTENGLVVLSVTQVLESLGFVNYNGISKAILEFKSTIGTAVHDTCSLLDRGENLDDYEIDSRVRPYVDSYIAFKTAANWKPVLVEHGPFIADINGMPVGFTLDRVGPLAGQETVAEIKCTSEHHASHALQTAFYDLCLGEMKRKRVTVLCRPDGKIADVKPHNDTNDYNVAISALACATWKRNMKL